MKKLFLFLALSLPILSIAAEEKVSGPWMRARWSNQEFRYVTTYSTYSVDKALKGFPWFQEECHDNGETDWSQWNQAVTHSVNYNGTVGFELLGFSLEFGRDVGRSHTIGFNRWISAVGGIRARHTLHEVYDVMKGVTRKEIKYADGTIRQMGTEKPFEITGLNYGLRVNRTILEVCEPEQLEKFMSLEQ